ncbi:MAG TPA: hypothetical protein VFJ02_01540 [Vicinamibacterales bacterium]|nr:hypothetical protein [Vicinamibacterales bacterium]
MKHLIKAMWERLLTWEPPPPDLPQPPFSDVLEPKHRGPGGRRDAAAIAEPEPDVFVDARISSPLGR